MFNFKNVIYNNYNQLKEILIINNNNVFFYISIVYRNQLCI